MNTKRSSIQASIRVIPILVFIAISVGVIFSWGINSRIASADSTIRAMADPSATPITTPEPPQYNCTNPYDPVSCEPFLQSLPAHTVPFPLDQNFIKGTSASIPIIVYRIPHNTPPTADSLSYTTSGESVNMTLSGSDPDGSALTYQILIEPRHGTYVQTGAEVVYTPNAGFQGQDAFAYVVSDGYLKGAAVVLINVGGSVSPPIINSPGDQTLIYQQTLTTSVDAESQNSLPLLIDVLSPSTLGSITGAYDNFTYNPGTVFGLDHFFIRVTEDDPAAGDGTMLGQVAIQIVHLTIGPPNANSAFYEVDPDYGGLPISQEVGGYSVDNGPIEFGGIDTTQINGGSDGPVNLIIRTLDDMQRYQKTSVQMRVDNTPPSIVWLDPPANPDLGSHPSGSYIGETVHFELDAADDVYINIEHLKLFIDHGSVPEIDLTYPPYLIDFSLLGLSDASHDFTFQAADFAGNINELDITYTVDNTPPSVTHVYFNSVEIDVAENIIVTGPVEIRADATDDISQVAHLSIWNPNNASPTPSCVVEPNTSNTSLTCNWDPAGFSPGAYTASVVSRNQARGSVTVPIYIDLRTNTAPTLPAIGNKSVDENALLTFTLTPATDPDSGQILTYSASNLPVGATFNTATRVFSWTPNYDQAGTYSNVTFTVTDNGTPALSDSEAITITAADINRSPQLEDIPDTVVSNACSLTATAYDPDVPPQTLSFSLTQAPAWMNIDSQSGLITCTSIPPVQNGATQAIIVRVDDDGSPMLSHTVGFNVTVDQSLPTVAFDGGEPTGPVSNPYLVRVIASDNHLREVKLFLDSEEITPSYLIPPLAAYYTWNLATNGLSTGNHLLTARAIDSAGNQANVNRTFEVLNGAPSVEITNTSNLAYVPKRTSILIYAQTEGTVDHVEISIGGGSSYSMTALGDGRYVYPWRTITLPDGPYTIRVVAVGTEGNPSTPALFDSIVDGIPPTVTITEPAGSLPIIWGVRTFSVTATETDGNPVSRIRFIFGSTQLAERTPSGTVSQFTGEYLLDTEATDPVTLEEIWPDGDYAFYGVAVDRAGNEGTRYLPFRIDNTNRPASDATITHTPGDDDPYVTTDAESAISFTSSKQIIAFNEQSISVTCARNGVTETIEGGTQLDGYTLRFSGQVNPNSICTVLLHDAYDLDGKLLSHSFQFHRMMARAVGGVVYQDIGVQGRFQLTVDPNDLPENMMVLIEPVDESELPITESGSVNSSEVHNIAGPFRTYGQTKTQSEIHDLSQPITLSYTDLIPPPQAEEQARVVQIQGLDGSMWRPLGTGNTSRVASADDPVGIRHVSVPVNYLATFRVTSVVISGDGISDMFNYPNPFSPRNGGTNFHYILSENSDVDVVIYDLFGNLVKHMFYPAGPAQGGTQGQNTIQWDGRNGVGHEIANGGYIVHIRARDIYGNESRVKHKVGVVK